MASINRTGSGLQFEPTLPYIEGDDVTESLTQHFAQTFTQLDLQRAEKEEAIAQTNYVKGFMGPHIIELDRRVTEAAQKVVFIRGHQGSPNENTF